MEQCKRMLQVSKILNINLLLVYCRSVSDDMTIWKWKDDGEPVSLKVVLNERIDLLVFRLGEGGIFGFEI